MNKLFSGALYFVRVEYTIQDQNNKVIAISNNDMNTIVEYASRATRPISLYAYQYGPNWVGVDRNVIQYKVTLLTASFNDGDLKSWVKDIISTNNLPQYSCVVVLKHDSIANSSWGPGTGGEHYQDIASYPYILSSVAGIFDTSGDLHKNAGGIGLTVADEDWTYAGNLSHEIAEMTVNPFGGNPEVCDPCGPNVVSTYLSYFTATGNYLQTTQTPPYLATFGFGFYINGIVRPGVNDIKYVNDKVIPDNACNYAPPLPNIGSEVAFQANTTNLWSIGRDNHADWQLGMMPGTSPSIAVLTNGDYVVAFQANTGNLWTIGGDNRGDWQLGMMAGTSPSITALAGGGYEIAFQANTSNLWIVGADYKGDMGLGMMPGTSPCIAALSGGGYEVAFQANTTNLWLVGSDYKGDMLLGMMPGTNPSITGLLGGGYEVAFQANNGNLWVVRSEYVGETNLGMMRGTSPAITGFPNGGYEVAFQANTSNLWTVGADNHGDWFLGMMAGTSPAIVSLPDGTYEVAFQANTGNLWTVGRDNVGDWGLGMMAGTNPAISR